MRWGEEFTQVLLLVIETSRGLLADGGDFVLAETEGGGVGLRASLFKQQFLIYPAVRLVFFSEVVPVGSEIFTEAGPLRIAELQNSLEVGISGLSRTADRPLSRGENGTHVEVSLSG